MRNTRDANIPIMDTWDTGDTDSRNSTLRLPLAYNLPSGLRGSIVRRKASRDSWKQLEVWGKPVGSQPPQTGTEKYPAPADPPRGTAALPLLL